MNPPTTDNTRTSPDQDFTALAEILMKKQCEECSKLNLGIHPAMHSVSAVTMIGISLRIIRPRRLRAIAKSIAPGTHITPSLIKKFKLEKVIEAMKKLTLKEQLIHVLSLVSMITSLADNNALAQASVFGWGAPNGPQGGM